MAPPPCAMAFTERLTAACASVISEETATLSWLSGRHGANDPSSPLPSLYRSPAMPAPETTLQAKAWIGGAPPPGERDATPPDTRACRSRRPLTYPGVPQVNGALPPCSNPAAAPPCGVINDGTALARQPHPAQGWGTCEGVEALKSHPAPFC